MNERDKNAVNHASGKNGGYHESYGSRYHHNGQITRKSYGEVFSDGNRYKTIDNMVFKNGSYVGRVNK